MKHFEWIIFRLGIVSTIVILNWIPFNASADTNFQKWVTDFYSTAAKDGIKQSTYTEAFKGVTAPDADVLRKANYQPEFTSRIWDYLDARVNPLSINNGLRMARQHAQTLAAIEQQFGVDRATLLSIWSVESNYGAALKNTGRLHYVPRSLATLAYADNRRKQFARTQLIAALKILQSGDISTHELMGSWAGAMGHTQFIPTSYLAYATDMDKDGTRDIWNSIPDALATAANLLKENGWRSGETWGYEVKLPANGLQYEDQTKTLAEWEKLGFVRPKGQAFPRPEKNAVLNMMTGSDSPAFLMTRNFFVIKRYNNSDFYALTVGVLADRLAGRDGLIQPWARPADSLTIEEKFELQQRLKDK
ncbi:MAG: lytic murein transglycosylase, partial [Nitrosomonas sp.]|nr:lytic murein transglycosylase [Nitrosomonas sp.]MDP1951636.1 lytic murein transglycosylase [Nitrosomonas sp.]